MCLLALFFRAVPDAAVVVGANREEHYARGGEPPRLLPGPMRMVAGVDPRAGGTWLGVNERGLVVAVTNRAKTALPAQPRSRGQLARDLLACPDAAAAVDQASFELGNDGQNRYAGCNVLLADRDRACVLLAGDWLRVKPLPPGLHVLTAADVNDASDNRIGHALHWLGQRDNATALECVAALCDLCAQTGNGHPPICLHGEKAGTVSSSILALRPSLARSIYFHAQGPPDRTPYEDVSELLVQLAGFPSGA
jgi:uncharacterized protein with NRDE domain